MSHSPQALQDKDVLTKYRDGWQTTSRLLREGKSFSGHETNCAYLNCEGSSFANVSAVTGLDFLDDGRAVCVTDWDHDGDLDLWFHNRTGPRLRLMRNQLVEMQDGKQTHSVSVRLRGRQSNRDGIGTRVIVWLVGDDKPLSQTLHAGAGFLSQSSKTMHFGLGVATQVERVFVRWPSGLEQTFRNIDADCRLLITEGESSPQVEPLGSRNTALAESTQPVLSAEPRVRTVLSNRLPLPLLPYQTLDGQTQNVTAPKSDSSGKLVVLVASWCPACRSELLTLKKNTAELTRAGLDVLVVALDGQDVQRTSGVEQVQQFASELELAFEVCIANSDFLRKLDLAQHVVLNRSPQLSVPLNLLMDRDGALAFIYRGPVEITTLLADVRQLDCTPRERRKAAVPFAGTWTTTPRQMLMRAVGRLFAENGFDDDELRYQQMETEMLERQRRLATSKEARQQLDSLYAAENYSVGVALMAKNEPAAAAEYFARAVDVDPKHVNAMVNLSVCYAQQQKSVEAIRMLERAIAVDADSVPARINLGNALSRSGRFAAAVQHYTHVVGLGKATSLVHSRLARALLEVGEVKKGATQLELAIQSGATDAATLVSLAWIKATSPDNSLRDGDRALELAMQIIDRRLGPPALAFDILGAARAEQGDFEGAAGAARKAVALMGGGASELREQIERRAVGYAKRKPHRDGDGKYP